jgi:Family of unknown function (DUF6335)
MRNRGLVSLEEIDDVAEILTKIDEWREHDKSVFPDPSAVGETFLGNGPAQESRDVLDDIGQAAGITYEEGEPLRIGEKEVQRNAHRWELDPASAEDYSERSHQRSPSAESIRRMRHQYR